MFEWIKKLANKIMPKKEVKVEPKVTEGCDYDEFHNSPNIENIARLEANMTIIRLFFECYNAREKYELTTERLRNVNFSTIENYIVNRYKVDIMTYKRVVVYQSSKLDLLAHFTKAEIDGNSDKVRAFRIAMTTPENKVRKFSSCILKDIYTIQYQPNIEQDELELRMIAEFVKIYQRKFRGIKYTSRHCWFCEGQALLIAAEANKGVSEELTNRIPIPRQHNIPKRSLCTEGQFRKAIDVHGYLKIAEQCMYYVNDIKDWQELELKK